MSNMRLMLVAAVIGFCVAALVGFYGGVYYLVGFMFTLFAVSVADYANRKGWGYVLTGFVLRKQARAWIQWLKDNQDQVLAGSVRIVDGPWLPDYYKNYLIRLIPALKLEKERQAEIKKLSKTFADNEAKKKRKRGRRK